jgi:hypothetical protein
MANVKKSYRVQFSVEIEASDRAQAFAKAQEIVKGNPAAKIKVQESVLGWLTVSNPETKS